MLPLAGLGRGIAFAGPELRRPLGILPPWGPVNLPSLWLAGQSHIQYGVKAPFDLAST